MNDTSLHRSSPPVMFCKLKKRLWHRCFPVNFAKFLRTTFFTEHLWWLLLSLSKQKQTQNRKKQTKDNNKTKTEHQPANLKNKNIYIDNHTFLNELAASKAN